MNDNKSEIYVNKIFKFKRNNLNVFTFLQHTIKIYNLYMRKNRKTWKNGLGMVNDNEVVPFSSSHYLASKNTYRVH